MRRFFTYVTVPILSGFVFISTMCDITYADGEKADVENPSFDSFFTLYQPYLSNISAYQPMYFAVGSDPEKSMFQFSFKYKFFNDNDPVVGRIPWITNIFFGYTQTSFWDLKSESKPFDDTSYKPEFFYLSSNFRSGHHPFGALFFQYGVQHESNGQSGTLSRSTNYLYFRPIMIFYHKLSGYGLQIAPKIWTYVMDDDDDNPDLKDYRGFFDLEVKFGKADSIVADTHFWYAREGVSGQLEVTCPLNRHLPTNLNAYLYIQYANRLAETLRLYRERSKAFRIGISIVR